MLKEAKKCGLEEFVNSEAEKYLQDDAGGKTDEKV